MRNETTIILNNSQVADDIFRMTVKTKSIPQPGQFFMIKGLHGDYLLPRPISVHDYDDGKLVFLYRLNGHGTKMFSEMKQESAIQLLGPLGNGFDYESFQGKTAIIGGGIGVAPLLYLVKKLDSKNTDVFLGFKDVVYAVDDFIRTGATVKVATEDGRAGEKGYVTDLIDYSKYKTVITCGPEVMMKKIIKSCIEKKINVLASLEERMACGVGACLGCVTKTIHGNKRVCKDGPIFDGRDLII
jgi:dihydroorotate dehydrogenase electron transfer subunit